MVRSSYTSKFKVMVFSVFGLSIILSLTLLLLTSPNIIQPEFWSDPHSILIFIASVIIFAFGCLPLLKMRTIRIEPLHIIYQKYVFRSNTREVNLKKYDYYKILYEESENGIFEAVWLIKDGKLADSFSSYQFSNYKDMENALNIRNEGLLDLSPIKQLLCKLGARI